MRRAWFCLVLVGCYSPHPETGSPCDPLHPCAAGLVCADDQTCQLTNAPVDDASLADTRLIDGCTPTSELCGDGIDQDCDGNDPVCPDNDKAAGAIDIAAGGTFTADLRYAHDDSGKPSAGNMPCGGDGGRDVYYKLHLAANEAIYLDTYGSDFDTVVKVYRGACKDVVPPVPGVVCHDNMCGTKQTQYVWDMLGGDNCIVVDQQNAAETAGKLVLHVERGGRTGTLLDLETAVLGNTANTSDQSKGICAPFTGNDLGYYFTECPAGSQTITATTCNSSIGFDSAVYAAQGNATAIVNDLACNDDDAGCASGTQASTISFQAKGPHLFWIIVDAGANGASGLFELDTTIQ